MRALAWTFLSSRKNQFATAEDAKNAKETVIRFQQSNHLNQLEK